MSASLLDSLSQMVTPDLLGQAASMLGENQNSVSRGVSAMLPMLLSGVATRVGSDSNFASTLFKMATDDRNNLGAIGNLAQLVAPTSANSGVLHLGNQLLGSLFGQNTGSVATALAGYSGIKPQSANSLLSMAAPMVLGLLGKTVRSGGLNLSSLTSLLTGQKHEIAAALPTGINLDRYLAAPAVAAMAAPVVKKPSIWRWLLPVLLVLGALLLLSRCMQKNEPVTSMPAPETQVVPAPAPMATPTESVPAALPKADVFFDTGVTALPADATTALAPVIAYLTANASSTVSVSGFHDPTGDLALNEELAKNRAFAVRDALLAAGVAEGRIELQKPDQTTGDGSLEAARRVEVAVR